MDFKYKYLKYKNKYAQLKMRGGMNEDEKEELLNIETSRDINVLNQLKDIYSDLDECIIFGIDVGIIKEYFEYFTNFKLVNEFNMLSHGSQGTVQLIKYKKHKYEIQAILKSSNFDRTDNTYYEYLVGQFLNKQLKFFPCFVETYGLFKYKNQGDINYQNSFSELFELINDIEEFNIDEFLKKSCENPKQFCVLMEYLKDTESIKQFIGKRKPLEYNEKLNSWIFNKRNSGAGAYDYVKIDSDYLWIFNENAELAWEFSQVAKCDLFINEMPYILFQIYMPLYFLSDVFTHYDLHWDNILLYKPPKPIKYFYYLPDGEVVSFYSPYIVKIIDYGRSYFYDDANKNSNIIYDKICKIDECNPECGQKKGYSYLPIKKNTSIDLKLFSSIKLSSVENEQIKKIIEKKIRILILQINNILDYSERLELKYEKDIVKIKQKELEKDIKLLNNKLENFNKYFDFQNKDTTQYFSDILHNENTNEYNGLNINNIMDLFIELKNLILLESFQENNTNTYGLDMNDIYGEFHVYGDKQTPFRFVKK